jgi:hypothetical protein
MSGRFVPIWIPTAFTAVLVFFFIAAYLIPPKNEGQLKILRFLAALCGAISAFMWTGEALVDAKGDLGGLSLAFSGSAGFAVFYLVWMGWEMTAKASIGFNFSVGTGADWTFENTAKQIAEAGGGNLVLVGFTYEHRATQLRPEKLFSSDARQALEKLRSLATSAIPKYDVAYDGADFTLQARS